MKGLEAIKIIDDTFRYGHTDDEGYEAPPYKMCHVCDEEFETAEKELKAFEFLTKNFKVMVGVDESKDLDFACLLLSAKEIDKIFELAIAYKQQDLETYNQLLNLKEVLENDSTKE